MLAQHAERPAADVVGFAPAARVVAAHDHGRRRGGERADELEVGAPGLRARHADHDVDLAVAGGVVDVREGAALLRDDAQADLVGGQPDHVGAQAVEGVERAARGERREVLVVAQPDRARALHPGALGLGQRRLALDPGTVHARRQPAAGRVGTLGRRQRRDAFGEDAGEHGLAQGDRRPEGAHGRAVEALDAQVGEQVGLDRVDRVLQPARREVGATVGDGAIGLQAGRRVHEVGVGELGDDAVGHGRPVDDGDAPAGEVARRRDVAHVAARHDHLLRGHERAREAQDLQALGTGRGHRREVGAAVGEFGHRLSHVVHRVVLEPQAGAPRDRRQQVDAEALRRRLAVTGRIERFRVADDDDAQHRMAGDPLPLGRAELGRLRARVAGDAQQQRQAPDQCDSDGSAQVSHGQMITAAADDRDRRGTTQFSPAVRAGRRQPPR